MGMVKLVFIYLPIILGMLIAYYFVGKALSAIDLDWLIAIFGGVVVGTSLWLFNMILGPSMMSLKVEGRRRK